VSPLTALTYVLPHRCCPRWRARWLTRPTPASTKQWLIDTVTRKFGVDLSEAAESDPTAYPTFNAFFTRALKPGARVPDPDPRALLMPADGRISQCGDIVPDGRIFQAKGQSFTAAELLGDADAARPFADGVFATVYLSPRDYHRVHMPWTGTLRETVHVPGRCSASAPTRWPACRGCSPATSAWSATSTPTSGRWPR
jgi:phosphatidylserine decarboxylase